MMATLEDRRVELAGCWARVEEIRRVPLTKWETDRLDILAFGELRRLEKLSTRRRELPRLAARVVRLREAALIASMGSATASVQPWEGPLGYENVLTGDGRLINSEALQWATMPLPLRYVPADLGGHDGAVLVGRIDNIERRFGGVVWGTGVLDLGSDIGQEVARLIAGGYLGGVSLDIDSTTTETGTLSSGEPASVVTVGRVRAATIVSIPAFADAHITLVGGPLADLAVYSGSADPHGPEDDCGCSELSTAGPVSFAPTHHPSTGANK